MNHWVMDLLQPLMLALVFLLAGCVKGVTGMGLPTVAVSLLGLWMTPAQAAAMMVIPSLTTNLTQCRGPYLGSLAKRLWPGWLAIAIVTIFVPGFGSHGSEASARLWLGAILMAYGTWGLWRPALPDLSKSSPWLSTVTGVATGLVTALTAVFVLPWVPYLQSLRFEKDELIQALGLSFTVTTLALAVRVQALTPHGLLSASGGVAVCLSLACAFAGLKAGESLRSRLAGPSFQRALFLVFIALGVANLSRTV